MPLLASEYDKSKYLRAEDVLHERKFRIKTVTVDELIGMNGGKEKKLVVWFTNDERGLVLNKTNNRTIRGAFGDNTAAWSGKIIVIFSMLSDVRGTMKAGLRVRIPPSKQQPTAAPASQPTPSGNGAAAAAKPAALSIDDPELAPDPAKTIAEDLDDEINF
jgi:hypothetical protein